MEILITEALAQYGVLGAWTITLLYEKWRMSKQRDEREEKLVSVIDENTKILTLIKEKMYGRR